jgi:hypothetical protein
MFLRKALEIFSKSNQVFSINARSLAVLINKYHQTRERFCFRIVPSRMLSDLEKFLARMILNLFRYFHNASCLSKFGFSKTLQDSISFFISTKSAMVLS